jgi:hypothetical protein
VFSCSRPGLTALDVQASRAAVVLLHKRKNMLLFNPAVMATPFKSSSDWFT